MTIINFQLKMVNRLLMQKKPIGHVINETKSKDQKITTNPGETQNLKSSFPQAALLQYNQEFLAEIII